jgi:hypothetical protein
MRCPVFLPALDMVQAARELEIATPMTNADMGRVARILTGARLVPANPLTRNATAEVEPARD